LTDTLRYQLGPSDEWAGAYSSFSRLHRNFESCLLSRRSYIVTLEAIVRGCWREYFHTRTSVYDSSAEHMDLHSTGCCLERQHRELPELDGGLTFCAGIGISLSRTSLDTALDRHGSELGIRPRQEPVRSVLDTTKISRSTRSLPFDQLVHLCAVASAVSQSRSR